MWAECGKGTLTKAWPLLPTWDSSRIHSVFRTSHEFRWSFNWELIKPSFCLCSAELCLFLLHRCWSQSSPYSLLHTNPFWVCFPGNPAWVCTNKRANPGCFYILGVQSGAFGIASLPPHTQSGLSFRLHLAIIPKSSSVVIIKPQTFTYPVYSNYLKEHLPSFSPQL